MEERLFCLERNDRIYPHLTLNLEKASLRTKGFAQLAPMPFLHLPESRTYINLDHVTFVEYLKGKTQKDGLVVKVFFVGVPSATIFAAAMPWL